MRSRIVLSAATRLRRYGNLEDWMMGTKKELLDVAEQSLALNKEQQDQIKQLYADNDQLIAQNKQLVAEVERLKSNESVPACVWAEDQEGNWDTKCGDKHYLTAGTPFENGMHWCCYCGGSLLEELYGEQAND